jgi:hypothetical protein
MDEEEVIALPPSTGEHRVGSRLDDIEAQIAQFGGK